ncbi:Gfo/Idh/MocA family protein [Marinobacterium aestuariivivens]|uniref:Gfo/Idh/MocA family protein n=1 Tax=Marinobacterium aestuariivivens TaxID=1698799 RepID=A0ABW1ZUH5_9GAMM
MLNIGVIGYGYWGPNLVRNFSESGVAQVTAVSDMNPERLQLVKKRYPATRTTIDHRDLLTSNHIQAVAIATPVHTHFTLAMEALKAGKHVFLEKPLTETTDQARQLIDEADKRGLILMVDHTFIFTGAVRKMRQLVESGEIGDIYYYDSVRVNLGLFQPDINVIWDLAVHDLAIMNYVFDQKPVAVSATGMSHVPGKPADIAYLSLFFENNMMGHVHINWLSPVKLRRSMIAGSRKMVVYDDLEPSEKIKIYDKGITITERQALYDHLVGYRVGDMVAPQLENHEALNLEARYFADCIGKGEQPANNGQAGLEVVEILEAATRSMQEKGCTIELNAGS